MRATEQTMMIFSNSLNPMRRRVTRPLIGIHAAWHLKTMDLESIFKTRKIRRYLEKSGEMVGLDILLNYCIRNEGV